MALTLIVLTVALVVAGGAVTLVVDLRRQEQELVARRNRHDALVIRPLEPGRARDYRAAWQTAQARFAGDPRGAIGDADTLIEALMGERGYPFGDVTTTLEDLSVEHANVLRHYREAHEIAIAAEVGDADVDSLRRAILHYRALFAALL